MFMNRKKIKKFVWEKKYPIILSAIIFFGISLFLALREPKSYFEANDCRSDSDCLLYDCTSCGNKRWVKRYLKDNLECDKPIPFLKGCVCREGVCKREYQN